MRGMRHFLAALLTAALLLSLAACGSTNSAGQLRLYYPAEFSTKSRSTGGGDAIASVQVDWQQDRKSTRLNSSHKTESRMPSSA